MDALKEKFAAWWGQRAERERKILLAAGLVAVVAFFHGYVYKPLADDHGTVLEAFEKATSDYRWLKEQVREIESLGGGVMSAPENLDQMQASLEEHLKAHGIQTIVERIEQRGKFFFEVRLKDIPGVKVMKWVETLAAKGYQVSRFRMENLNGKLSGRVIVRATA